MEQLVLLERDCASMEFTVDNLEEMGSSNAEVVEMRHPQEIQIGNGNPSDEKSGQSSTVVSNQLSIIERKRHSDPSQASVTEGRCRFDRRRIFSQTKQDSYELPDDLPGQTEDNVFSYPLPNGHFFRRCLSFPAKLDNYPEPDCETGDSPDVLSQNNDIGDLQQHSLPVKSILSSRSPMSKVEEAEEGREDLIEKQNFEGSVCYIPVIDPSRRKKSVTFEMTAHVVKMLSEKGKAARSRFLSSGYGSQSDGSQASQASNGSSQQSSMMSDEALESSFNKDSFESDSGTEELVNSYCQSITSTDGSIDGKNEETENKGAESEGLSSQQICLAETAAQDQKANEHSTHSSPGNTPEEGIDKTELWCRQMQPKFHCGGDGAHDVPNLSIFDEDFSNQCSLALEEELFKEESRVGDNPAYLENGAVQGSQSASAVSPQNKPSPITREECLRELYRRMFDERMQNYDHTKESLSELLDWLKNNIGDALTPSPKSPFFAMDVAQQSGNHKVQQAPVEAKQGGKCTDPLHPMCRLAQSFCVMEKGASAKPADNVACGIRGQQQQEQKQQQALHHHFYIGGQQDSHQMNLAAGSQPNTDHLAIPHAQLLYEGTTPIFAQPQNHTAPPVKAEPNCPNTCLLPTCLEEPTSSVNYQCSSFFSSVSDSHLEQLVNISQCTYSKCILDACKQTKRRVSSLKNALMRGTKTLSEDDAGLLKLLQEHYNTGCDLLKCSVPWCFLMAIASNCPSQKKIQQELTSLLSNPVRTMLPDKKEFDNFLKLDSSLPLNSMPVEWEDWVMLCPLSLSFTVARAFVPTTPGQHWVIKMTYLHEERRHQLEMLEKLRDLQHSHIIKHNWVATSNSKQLLVICTNFLPGVSLRDLLDQRVTLSIADAFRYLKQILSASISLHRVGIVYLNWMCSNILLDQNCENLKLTNFTSSVDLSSGLKDFAEVKLTLPADVVPAELLLTSDGPITPKSDSWGVACILHEMLVGVRPWFHLRHSRPEDIWKQMDQQIPPCLPRNLVEDVKLLMQACLQRDPEDRFSIEQIMERI